ncbi:MAG: DEDD exonuclease domain-containing protein [Actinomycetota bacterium]
MLGSIGTGSELDPETPLREVTFCVVDLETTGGSPRDSSITEVGAVRYLGGERVGTFHSLVNPGEPIPRFITHLTGIEDLDLLHAPPIEAVLPSLLEFLRGAVFVAHNARFDFGFIRAAARQLGYPEPEGPPVCTAKLARRVAWDNVRNVRLDTLARHFRTDVAPTHRAFPDAEACAGVLHSLLELGGRLGILTLGDLRESMRARGQPHYAKIRLADALPHARGVYLFRDRHDLVLYVGKATDLRSRVKSYFYGDERKRVRDLLARTERVEYRVCRTELESLVAEARLIARHEPPHNRRGRTWRAYAYLKVDLTEAWPRIKVVPTPGPPRLRSDDVVYLGPFHGRGAARAAKDALEDVVPIRRCTRSMGRTTRFSPCALAGMGRCVAPCIGRVTSERYEELVRGLIRSLSSPGGLLEALEARMTRLAAQERFEGAARARDRLHALAEAIARGRQDRWLIGSGRLRLRSGGGADVLLAGGSLAAEPWEDGVRTFPCPPDRADELAAVRGQLARHPPAIVHADRPLAEPVDGGRALAGLLARLRSASQR